MFIFFVDFLRLYFSYFSVGNTALHRQLSAPLCLIFSQSSSTAAPSARLNVSVCILYLSCEFCFDPLILSGCLAGIRILIRILSFEFAFAFVFVPIAIALHFARHRRSYVIAAMLLLLLLLFISLHPTLYHRSHRCRSRCRCRFLALFTSI